MRIQEITKKVNREQKRLVLELGDWIWVNLQKDRFPTQIKSKFMPRVDDLFQVHERINNNPYRIDLSWEYQVQSTFNVAIFHSLT